MIAPTAVITIGLDPDIHLGPITLAWHGLTIAIGILIGGVVATRFARKRGLAGEPVQTIVGLAAVGGLLGGRLFYVAEHGGALLSTRGFTFDGGFILAGLAIAFYVHRAHLPLRYLDAAAFGLPLGVAIGRIGDIINGEHYGARSDFFLAVRNSSPDALTPDPRLAFQNGGLYEVLLATIVFALIWFARDRLPRPGDLAWFVLALFAAGRFFEFFLRSDSPALALGLDNAQWTSLVLLAFALVGRALQARLAARRPGPGRRRPQSPAQVGRRG